MSSKSRSNSSANSTDGKHRRQPAKRVFADEFQDATYMFKEEEGDRAPKFLLLPTGERANRVFVVGTLTDAENIGTKGDYWQARIVDPSETFFMYAGQYQPDAMAQLESIEPPKYVAGIGKPRTYETDGEIRSSLTIEHLTVMDGATRDRWVLDAALATKGRLEASQCDDPPADTRKAAEIYDLDYSRYWKCVREAWNDLTDGESPERLC